MKLDDVDVEQLTGILVNDQHWGKKGKRIKQRFHAYIPDEIEITTFGLVL